MPKTEVQPSVVALLCDSDFKYRPDTNTWTHRDGRPFSKEEQALALTATRADLEEVQQQLARYRKYRKTVDEAPESLERFLAPFMSQLTERKLGNAVKLMGEDDRLELDRLLGLVTEPVRRFAPYAF
ncbi:hypothetical protein JI76_20380 [Streptomyces anulatus]|uniref:hypothetical protein n=1 Tax=Streptomyces anulatus TaxID=1892 RepID=UPI0006D95549|nr:hypothetical protein [Streptomyces anulatus]KPL31509.1 hypothetical protein JI76_20380 [Streptomyces anulatus]